MKTDTTAREAVSKTKGWWFIIFLLTAMMPVFLIIGFFHSGAFVWAVLAAFGWLAAVVRTSREMTKLGYYTAEEKAEMAREKQERS